VAKLAHNQPLMNHITEVTIYFYQNNMKICNQLTQTKINMQVKRKSILVQFFLILQNGHQS